MAVEGDEAMAAPLEDAKRGRKRSRVASKAAPSVSKKDAEEADRLQKLLFGRLAEGIEEEFGKEFDSNLDFATQSKQKNDPSDTVDGETDGDSPILAERKPVWVDEEEEEAVVKIAADKRRNRLMRENDDEFIKASEYVSRIRAQHAKLNPGTDWAELPSEQKGRSRKSSESESEDEEDEGGTVDDEGADILLKNDDLVVKNRSRLPEGMIDLSKMHDANAEDRGNAVVQSVEFHRNAQVLMTAGFDKRLRFFHIDGKHNPKVQSIFLDNFPIHKASFTQDGTKVLAASRRKYYYLYDLLGGKVERITPLVGREEKSLQNFELAPDSKIAAFLGNGGYIMLSSLSTKNLIGTLKMNGSARALAFTSDGKQLMSSGGDGEIYCWDLRMRRCIYKARDEGCITSTSLCLSKNNQFLASGSDAGVVNIYNKDDFLGGVSKPLKTVMNLTTAIDVMKFNCDSQILAVCSRMKKNALRLLHLPSFTVFSNWPTANTPLQYVNALDFSPGGGYLAVGNAAGKVLLYRLKHYEHA